MMHLVTVSKISGKFMLDREAVEGRCDDMVVKSL